MKTTWVILGFLIFMPALFGQEVDEQMQVRLVELDVKVTQWSGEFVSGLSQSEFNVRENGKRQNIESFEEVNLANMAASEQKAYQSRIMLVLDLKNTPYSVMKRTFPALKEYADTMFNGRTEMGLAMNAEGFGELQSFTSDREVFFKALQDAEAFYHKSKYRLLRPSTNNKIEADRTIGPRAGLSSAADGLTPADASFYTRTNNVAGNRYLESELQAMRQFVNYLSAYSGKKSIALVSGFWNIPLEADDLREIVSTCVLHKISINVLGMNGPGDITEERFKLSADTSKAKAGQNAGLAANTAGYNATASYGNLAKLLDATVKHTERYYRIRYYSEIEEGSFRKVKVNVPGIRRVVSTFSGYHSGRNEITAQDAQARLAASSLTDADLNLAMDTSWMNWEWRSVGKRQAFYAISQRAYDHKGMLIGEKVNTGHLVKRKYSGSFEDVRLEKEYALKLPKQVARLAFVVTDLNTGKKVEITQI